MPDNIVLLYSEAMHLDAVCFATRFPGLLRLGRDATHDLGLQKWKLFCLGLLGVHFSNAEWSVAFLPLGFAAQEKHTLSCDALFLTSTHETIPLLQFMLFFADGMFFSSHPSFSFHHLPSAALVAPLLFFKSFEY